MSTHLAIAAVTEIMRQLIAANSRENLKLAEIFALPLDVADEKIGASLGINLFLYHIAPNAALRNSPLPSGQSGSHPAFPLALDLAYLVTAYDGGDGKSGPVAQRILGDVMRVLHDHPVLLAKEINGFVSGSELAQQVERVRLTWEPLSLEELSKIWSMNREAGYRLSVGYRASVILVESRRPTTSAAPVLERGPVAQPGWSSLDTVSVRGAGEGNNPPSVPRPAARPGDTLILKGLLIGGADRIRITRPDGSSVDTLPGTVSRVSDQEVSVGLTGIPDLIAGLHAVALILTPSGTPERTTNALSFALAPVITLPNAAANQPTDVAPGPAQSLSIMVAPPVRRSQRTSLLLGSVPLPPKPFGATPTDTTATLQFDLPASLRAALLASLTQPPAPGAPPDFVARLRVDGVDSQPFVLFDPSTATPPASGPSRYIFDPAQKVRLI